MNSLFEHFLYTKKAPFKLLKGHVQIQPNNYHLQLINNECKNYKEMERSIETMGYFDKALPLVNENMVFLIPFLWFEPTVSSLLNERFTTKAAVFLEATHFFPSDLFSCFVFDID